MGRIMKSGQRKLPGGVWSAAPTPFTRDMDVDEVAVRRMVEQHVRLGVQGLFLAGTNGEGPWMTDGQRWTLVKAVAKCNRGRMPIAVQVTDNSAARVLENMGMARQCGADVAVIAPPYMMCNITPATVRSHYVEAIRRSPLPVGIYDRGKFGAVVVPDDVLAAIYREPNVVMIKDSSTEPARMRIALEVKRRRPGLVLLNGSEFNCISYLQAGYDGLLLGGGVFNGRMAGLIVEAVCAGRLAEAERMQKRMNRVMYAVYGGKKIACWLSGEKKLLVEMGVFRTWRNYPDYPLSRPCVRAIRQVMKTERKFLCPDS